MPFPPACRGKGCLRRGKSLPKSPRSASEVPSAFRSSEKLLNLSTSCCFLLGFGEPSTMQNPGPRDGLGVWLRCVAHWACSRRAFPPACQAQVGSWQPRLRTRLIQRPRPFSPCLTRKTSFRVLAAPLAYPLNSASAALFPLPDEENVISGPGSPACVPT